MMNQSNAKVLVIDDDDTIRELVEFILNRNGYTPVCASNGKNGIEMAIVERPKIILLDRRMPDMDGNETLIRLKNNDALKDIPVIMLSGSSISADVQASFELGAVDYIVKPFKGASLIASLEKALKLENSDKDREC